MITDDEPNLFVGLGERGSADATDWVVSNGYARARLTIAKIAAKDVADCQVWCDGNVGWYEPCYALARGLTGRLRGRYQRAFHRALKRLAKT